MTATTDPLAQIRPAPTRNDLPKDQQVQQMFDRIAQRYDVLNDVISFGMHRHWKKVACQQLQLMPGGNVLDVCTGTGDLIALLSQQVTLQGQVTGLDFSADMLKVARQRYPGQANLQLVLFQLDSNSILLQQHSHLQAF